MEMFLFLIIASLFSKYILFYFISLCNFYEIKEIETKENINFIF